MERVLYGGFNWAIISSHPDAPGLRRVIIVPRHQQDAQERELFCRAARVWVALPGIPGIASCVDVSLQSDPPFAVLEFIDGPTLTELLLAERRATGCHRLHPRQALMAVSQAARALAQLNEWARGERGAEALVHRDLHPGNIMFDRDWSAEGRWRTRLIDLGICKLVTEQSTSHTMVTAGVARYMAPEAHGGLGEVTPQSDLYALGAILYRMLAGRDAFPGGEQILIHKLHERFEPLSHACPDLPATLDQVIVRLLRADPAERYPTARELAQDLDEIARHLPPEGGHCTTCGFDSLARQGQCPICGGTITASAASAAAVAPEIGGQEGRPEASVTAAGVDWIAAGGGSYPLGLPAELLATVPIMPEARTRLAQRSAGVAEFEIARTAVTNEQYRRFVRATGHRQPAHWTANADRPFPAELADLPVVNVSWSDAQAYCRWVGGRLPTGPEWEVSAGWDAARGRMRRYPWGDRFDPRACNTAESGRGAPVPVDEFVHSASPSGALQMAGNVWEWVDGGTGDYKCVRGSSFQDSGELEAMIGLDITLVAAESALPNLGFRPARSTPAQQPDGPRAVAVPRGSYPLGIPPDRAEALIHSAALDPANLTLLTGAWGREFTTSGFQIAVYPVTNAEYWEFVRATGHGWPAQWREDPWFLGEDADPPFWALIAHCPVTGVTLEDARRYCEWLGVRLPTPEEWEVAARGPTMTVYPWGDSYEPGRANDLMARRGRPSPVYDYPAGRSGFGLLDAVGNVWEWTAEGTIRGGAYNSACDIYGLPHVSLVAVAQTCGFPYVGFRWVRES